MTPSYQATFDVLVIVDQMQLPFGGVSEPEVHLLAYLACLLSLYQGKPSADWGYGFVKTTSGAPFSQEINEAVREGVYAGLIREGDLLSTTEEASALRRFLSQRSQHAWRVPCLTGATDSVLSLPSGLVRSALREEPSLSAAHLHAQARALLDRPSIAILYDHFAALQEAVGPGMSDLMVPATVWLRYLTEISEHHSQALPAAAITND